MIPCLLTVYYSVCYRSNGRLGEITNNKRSDILRSQTSSHVLGPLHVVPYPQRGNPNQIVALRLKSRTYHRLVTFLSEKLNDKAYVPTGLVRIYVPTPLRSQL